MGQKVGDMAYLARVAGEVTIYCSNIVPGEGRWQDRLCGHRRAFAPAELVAQYGPDMPVQAWYERLSCSKCGSAEHLDMKAQPASNEYRKRT